MSGNSDNSQKSISSDLDLPLLGTIVIVSALLIVAIVMGIMAMYHNVYEQQRAMNAAGVENAWLSNNHAPQQRLLEGQADIYDSAAGYFNIPIDRAMQQYIDRTQATDGQGPMPPKPVVSSVQPAENGDSGSSAADASQSGM